MNTPVIPPPAWANWTNANYPEDSDLAREISRAQQEEWATSYVNAIFSNDLKDRMSFFWSNILVTEFRVYNCNAFLYQYTNCLQRNALGNFKTFISEIGLTNAMLVYLDGVSNRGNNPNEIMLANCMSYSLSGEGNGYTEQDIIETARALSGYTNRGEVGCSNITFRANHFDNTPKNYPRKNRELGI